MRHEGAVRLRAVPGTLGPQGLHQKRQARHLVFQRGRSNKLGDEERGQVIGLERAVEVPPPDADHLFVLEPEMVQDHHFGHRAVSVVQGRQLDVGEQRLRPALRDQEGPASVRDLPGELFGIDQADPRAERVDAEPLPGQVEKRKSRARW